MSKEEAVRLKDINVKEIFNELMEKGSYNILVGPLLSKKEREDAPVILSMVQQLSGIQVEMNHVTIEDKEYYRASYVKTKFCNYDNNGKGLK